MKEEAAEGDEKEAEKEDGDEKKEEKRLRDGHKPSEEDKKRAEERAAAGDTIYLAVTGNKRGTCTFAGVYNESWDWTLSKEEQSEDATFVTFELSVFEMMARGDDKAEEKAE